MIQNTCFSLRFYRSRNILHCKLPCSIYSPHTDQIEKNLRPHKTKNTSSLKNLHYLSQAYSYNI